MAQAKLSETAQKLVDVAVCEFNKTGSRAQASFALDRAIYELFESLPANNKALVTDTLIEIARGYIEQVITTSAILVGGIKAVVVKKANHSSGFIVQLLEPVQGKHLAVVPPFEARGTIDLWNKLGSEELEGVLIDIIELQPGTDAFKVVEFTAPIVDGKVQRLSAEELFALREKRPENSSA